MIVEYSFNKQTYVGDVGFDSRTHASSIGLVQSITRTLGFRAAYRRSDGEFIQREGSVLPLLAHMAELGFHYQRRLSRRRQLSFSWGAGALHVDTIDVMAGQPVEFWARSGYGTVRIDLGRSWNVAGDYRRSTPPLQGVTPEAFVTDAGIISAGGFLSGWLESVFTAGYSNGAVGYGRQGQGVGHYDGYTGTAQLRFRLTRFWSALVSANHYQYRLNTAASDSLGVSPETHRNSVRVGIAWSLPLFGSSLDAPGVAGGGD